MILSHEELGLLSVFANSAQEKGACPEFKSAIQAFENLLSKVLDSRYSLLWVMRASTVHVSPKLEALEESLHLPEYPQPAACRAVRVPAELSPRNPALLSW